MGYSGSADGSGHQQSGADPEQPDARSGRRSFRNRAGGRANGGGPPLESLYDAHYRSLVRLAALLTGDADLAENVAADSLAAFLSGSFGVRPAEPTAFWLHRQVVLRSRRAARGRRPATAPGNGLAAGATPVWRSAPIMELLDALSASQREAVVLRHYLELTDEQTAAVMGATLRGVRRNLDAARLALPPYFPPA